MTIPHYSINKNLVEIPEDPKEIIEYIKELQTSINTIEDSLKKSSVLGEIGFWFRILGQLDQAQEFIQKSLEINGLPRTKIIQQNIRLAHVLQRKKQFQNSNQLFEKIIKECRENKELHFYLSFALQHSGKNLFDQGRYQDSLHLFNEALTLRESLELIESTQFAIQMAKERIDNFYLEIDELIFKTINLDSHTEISIRFREDSFIESFGDNSLFLEKDGQGPSRYIDWLRAKISKDNTSAVHIWENDSIIGQMELGIVKESPDTANIGLFYLIPEKRGQGYSHFLNQYANWFVNKLGLTKARLSVSPTNHRAIKFYKKNGWVDIGPRPNYPEVHLMIKNISF